MSQTQLASTDQPDIGQMATLIQMLTEATERLAQASLPADLRLYTPEQVAELIGKSSWWVCEEIRRGRIQCTYLGKSPRLTAAHIRLLTEREEFIPNQARAA